MGTEMLVSRSGEMAKSNDERQGKQQCAKRTYFDLLKKKFNFLYTCFF